MGQTASSSASPDMPEQEAFREAYAELMEAIQDPVYLAANLYSAGIIPLPVRAEMTTPGVSRFEKNEKLLTAVESRIKANPQNFILFLSVLSRDSSLKTLVEKLHNAYGEGGGHMQHATKTKSKPRNTTARSRRKRPKQLPVTRTVDCEPQSSCSCCTCVISVAVLITVLYIIVNGKTHTPTHDLVDEHATGSHHRPEDIPSDLPKLSGPFVGREEQVNEIVRYLKSESVNIVSIYGPPAFGKSTLAIHVGYKMVESGFPVRYIDMTETNFAPFALSKESWKKLLTHSLAVYIVTIAGTKLDEHELPLYENWAELLKWAKLIETHTILLLDNCDKILHERREEFHNVIKLMQQFSQSKMKIIITSQERIKFLEASYAFSVSELSPSASVQLLQELAHAHGVNQVTTAEGKELASLVGNCPLALKVTAMLLREHSNNASVLVRKFKRALLPTISDQGLPQQHRFTALMDLAYNFLDETTRICSHYINLFPGSFDSDAADHILKLCQVPSGNECLLTLLWRSLVEEYVHGNDIRFKIHKLIKTYFIEKLASTPRKVDPKLLKNVFNNSFRMHYSEYVASFAQQIINGPVHAVMEHKFKSEAHNVQFLLQILLDNPLRSEFVAGTLAFAYHMKMLPDDHTVYIKIFYTLSQRNTFHFICKVLGKKCCATVYISVLRNLYLSASKNEPQNCKVFSCDQVYAMSRQIEELWPMCGNTSEATAVKSLIDRDYLVCSTEYFFTAGLCIIFIIMFCVVVKAAKNSKVL